MGNDVVLSMTLPVKSYVLEDDGGGFPLAVLERMTQKELGVLGWADRATAKPVWIITKTRWGVLNKEAKGGFFFFDKWLPEREYTFPTAVEAWQWWQANRGRVVLTEADYEMFQNETEEGSDDSQR